MFEKVRNDKVSKSCNRIELPSQIVNASRVERIGIGKDREIAEECSKGKFYFNSL